VTAVEHGGQSKEMTGECQGEIANKEQDKNVKEWRNVLLIGNSIKMSSHSLASGLMRASHWRGPAWRGEIAGVDVEAGAVGGGFHGEVAVFAAAARAAEFFSSGRGHSMKIKIAVDVFVYGCRGDGWKFTNRA
jgi:hypothetical protein